MRKGDVVQKLTAYYVAICICGITGYAYASQGASNFNLSHSTKSNDNKQMTKQAQEEENHAPSSVAKNASLIKLFRLPDLFALARGKGAADLHLEQKNLMREYDQLAIPYRYSMPYRHPGEPCKNSTHDSVPMIRHTLVDPRRKLQVALWEADLHEASEHGAALPQAVVQFLAELVDAPLQSVNQEQRAK